jgi:hypothetical protein
MSDLLGIGIAILIIILFSALIIRRTDDNCRVCGKPGQTDGICDECYEDRQL